MSEVLNDNSTLFDALHLAYSYYNYLIPCLIKNNKTITQEEMDLQIKHLGKFLDSPYNTIINNVSLIEDEIDISHNEDESIQVTSIYNNNKEMLNTKSVEELIQKNSAVDLSKSTLNNKTNIYCNILHQSFRD